MQYEPQNYNSISLKLNIGISLITTPTTELKLHMAQIDNSKYIVITSITVFHTCYGMGFMNSARAL